MAVAAIASVVRAQSQAGSAQSTAAASDSSGARRAPEASDNPPSAKRRKKLSLKGVSFHERDKCYFARFTIDGATRNLGRFITEERAAVAYDLAMLSLRARSELAGILNFSDAEREQLVEQFGMRTWTMPPTKAERATVRTVPPAPEEDNTEETFKKQKKEKKEKKANRELYDSPCV